MKNIVASAVLPASLSPQEKQQFIEWAFAALPVTNMDPDVIRRSAILVASDHETTAFATVQKVLLVDNYIPRPGLEDRRRVLSLRRFDQLLEHAEGEALFTTKDEHYAAMAEKRGWQMQKNLIVLRKNLNG